MEQVVDASSLVHRVSRCVGFPSTFVVSDAIVALCTSVSYTTAPRRAAVALRTPDRLHQLRRERLALDRGSAELRANRREANQLVRRWETARSQADGGLRRRRFWESWRSLSFLSFHRNGAPTCDRCKWCVE